ncbi:hypothetical protein CDL15_Pgr011672 [Punica granatum]|uniref:Uncharacterized protein n=1 Tax=Punica granatum TaxID=22663 RepID=A0A218WVS9_PUNGR|nr:hypothetical protein CDL15_Pgr011672 [Punica granatum]
MVESTVRPTTLEPPAASSKVPFGVVSHYARLLILSLTTLSNRYNLSSPHHPSRVSRGLSVQQLLSELFSDFEALASRPETRYNILTT